MSDQSHPDDIISRFTRIFDKLNIISTNDEDELWNNLMIYIYERTEDDM